MLMLQSGLQGFVRQHKTAGFPASCCSRKSRMAASDTDVGNHMKRARTAEENEPLVPSPLSERAEAAYGHFAETTTFGGVIHTYLSPHVVWKAIWVVIVLCLLAATIWNTTLVVQDYLSYPVTTKVTVSYEPSVPFPTVTVCNRNPIQCLKLTFAYIKHPEELNDLFYYSNCIDSVGYAPLIYRLFLKSETNSPEVLSWREASYANISQAIENGQFALLGKMDEIQCSDAFEKAGGVPNITMEETLKILTETCKSSMELFLFPNLHEPSDAKSLANVGSTSERPTSDKVLAGGAAVDTKTTTEDPSLLDYVFDDYMADFNFEDAPKDIKNNERFILEFTEIAKNRSKLHLLRELLDTYDEFIVNCTYFGQSCLNKTDFVLNYVPSYGSCFSFNSAFGDFNKTNSVSGTRKAYLTGGIYGLSLEVVLDQENYLPSSAAAGAGARVTISPPGVRPNPSDEGYYVKPHSEADLSLRLLKVTRKAEPYASQCWDNWESTSFKPLSYNPRENTTAELKVYSYAECRQVCSSYLLAQHCKCVDAHNPHPFLFQGQEMTGSLKVCDMTNKTDTDCRQGVLKKMETDDNYKCSCNLPCEDNQYIATSSTSEWPSDMYMPSVVEKYRQTFSKISDASNTDAWTENGRKIVSRELVRINVYMQTLNIQQISEEPKYDFFQLLSALGGALGLYLGFCGITLFEILEFLILMVISFMGFNVSKLGSKSSNPTSNTNERSGMSHDAAPRSAGALVFARSTKSAQLRRFFTARRQDDDQNLNKRAVFQDPPGLFVPKSAGSRIAFVED